MNKLEKHLIDLHKEINEIKNELELDILEKYGDKYIIDWYIKQPVLIKDSFNFIRVPNYYDKTVDDKIEVSLRNNCIFNLEDGELKPIHKQVHYYNNTYKDSYSEIYDNLEIAKAECNKGEKLVGEISYPEDAEFICHEDNLEHRWMNPVFFENEDGDYHIWECDDCPATLKELL